MKFSLSETVKTSKAIVEGYSNLAKASLYSEERKSTDPVEVLAMQRLSICQGCEFFIEKNPEAKNTQINLDNFSSFYSCPKCGCQLKAKVRQSTQSCPINKW